jgi:hypothetical protein
LATLSFAVKVSVTSDFVTGDHVRTTAIFAALAVAGFFGGSTQSLATAQPKKAATTQPKKAAALKVKSYLDPGLQYFRAAEPALGKAGATVDIDIIEGDWFDSKPAYLRADVMKSILKGKTVSTGTRRLTAAEKAKGLSDAVLGYYAALLYVHPDAPIDSIDTKKWKAVLKPGKSFTWKDIASNAQHTADKAKVDGKNPVDNVVSWSFPDAAYAAFAKPFIRLGAISPALIKSFPKQGRDLTPIAATYVVADYQDKIGIFGYNLVLNNQIHPLKPVRLLKINGVYPTDKTIADGSYPFAAPVTVVYSTKAGESPEHPVRAMLDFLTSEPAVAAAQQRSLVRRL